MWLKQPIFFSVFPVYETVTPLTEDVHGSAAMVETMTTLLQAQAEAMAAHPRATAAQQQLPALPLYTGRETGNRLQMTALSVLKWRMIMMFNRKLLDKTDCLTPLHSVHGVTMYPLSPPQNPTYSAIWTT